MAEKSFPWTASGTGDGTVGGYTALEWGEIWRRSFLNGLEASSGVLRFANDLAVSGSASPLAVNTGAAYVYGKHYYNDASLNLTVSTPSVGTTGGHVILRLDWSAQTVRAVAVRNTDGVSGIPSLTQSTSTQWEIRLATFTITTGGVITLTDARGYLHPSFMLDRNRVDGGSNGRIPYFDANGRLTDDADLTFDGTQVNLTGVMNVVGNILLDSGAVPYLAGRQGNSSTVWSTPGTTNYGVTGGWKMQMGAAITSGGGTVTVTWPSAFSAAPLVFCMILATSGNRQTAEVTGVNATTGTIETYDSSGTLLGSKTVYWLAIGPE